MKTSRQVVDLRPEPELLLAAAEDRIAWVLEHPQMSDWLKQALRSADEADPVVLQNDLEMIRHLLLPRCQAQIDLAVATASIATVPCVPARPSGTNR